MPELTNEEVDRIINAELQLALSGKLDETAPATAEDVAPSEIAEVGKAVYAYNNGGIQWSFANEEMVRKADVKTQFVMAKDLVGIYYAIHKLHGLDGDTITMFRTVDDRSFLHRIKYIQEMIKKEGNGDFYEGFEKFLHGRLRGSFGYYDNNIQTTEDPAVAMDISFTELLDLVDKHGKLLVGHQLSPSLCSYLNELYKAETHSQKKEESRCVELYGEQTFMLDGYLFTRHYSNCFKVEVLTEKHLKNQAARRRNEKKRQANTEVANHFQRINSELSHVLHSELRAKTSWFCNLRISQTIDLLRAAKTIGCRNEFRNGGGYIEVIKKVKPELLAKYKTRSLRYRKLCAFFLAEHRRLVKS